VDDNDTGLDEIDVTGNVDPLTVDVVTVVVVEDTLHITVVLTVVRVDGEPH
jgi:hypothetical protein